MIQHLSRKYKKVSASLLLTIFYLNFLFSAAYSMGRGSNGSVRKEIFPNRIPRSYFREDRRGDSAISYTSENKHIKPSDRHNNQIPAMPLSDLKKDIGGPSQPEMTSFKSAGVDNMVNLFTGDFSYNVPLMDVGGYPVNLFYDASISMEQEASWVGLGWNINPGNINRNMRGVPDDFDGTEFLTQKQIMKPNKTWGVNLAADLEKVGIKGLGVNASFGVSVNNYLGPALELGAGLSAQATLIKIADDCGSEKTPATASAGVGATLSSRNGLTVSPYASLSGQASLNNQGGSIGLGLSASTSYNSRSGIKALQLGEQMSLNKGSSREACDEPERYANTHNSVSGSLLSTSISFAKPSYVPAMRMKITNSSTAGRFQLGGALFGIYGSAQLQGYSQVSAIAPADIISTKPMIGYLNYQNAASNSDAIMDFSRFNDKEVMPTTPMISVPQYAYDVFTIQGEGTGGSVRAFRSDVGYVRDNLVESRDKSSSAGLDIGIPGHVGGNFSVVRTPSSTGDWNENNRLRGFLGFKANDQNVENVYFGNPGESTVISQGYYDNIGGTDLVKFQLDGPTEGPAIEPLLDRFSNRRVKIGTADPRAFNASPQRKKRTQVVSFLTAKEATYVGLDKQIKSYDPVTIPPTTGNGSDLLLNVQSSPRVDGVRKENHISEIDVTESNGKRYVYGLPVYNLTQKDYTFSVDVPKDNDGNPADPSTVDRVPFSSEDTKETSQYLDGSSNNKKDGYLLTTETPGYAHSFLLTGLLSSDYVDVKGDGITEDDLGTAVKFNYTKMANKVVWRTPLSNNFEANYNPGKLTEGKDDKGVISYGERESWYLHSIESKSMVALFTLESRDDGKGASGIGTDPASEILSGINAADDSKKRLQKIDLYNKADIKANGIGVNGAKPIKTVWFDYDYRLCQNTPDHPGSGGKLTLTGIHFTYNGKRESSSIKDKYVFSYSYDKANVSTSPDNPAYELNGSDRWGTYKANNTNPAGLRNSIYPYTIQDKTSADINAGAWALKKILLPSGGQIEVKYESDDYAFVQNKRAAAMMQIVGFSDDPTNAPEPKLYKMMPGISGANSSGPFIKENNYVFIHVPIACTANDVQNLYLNDIEQFAFKLAVQMPKGIEYISSYATLDDAPGVVNYGIYGAGTTSQTIWIKVKEVDHFSPLSLNAIEFLRQQLPGQAYKGYDVSENSGLKQQFNMLLGLLDGLVSASTDPVNFLRVKGLAQQVNQDKSFVRLNAPDGHKIGGGHRVKSIKLIDNLAVMKSGLYNSTYGKEYDYTTTEILNGTERSISSGVASYEPSFGGDENPFQKIWQYSSGAPLGPANYDAVEMPVLDAFFPAPLVGYSKITVRSTKPKPTAGQKSRSAIGKLVTEFYTAKDFPVYTDYTDLNPESDKTAHASAGEVFYSYSFDSRAISQGFVVALNDMHGKLRSQAAYNEYDDKTPIHYTENFYKNTGVNGLAETFKFVNAAEGGVIRKGNMGIDIELMTDLRQFTQKTNSFEVQAQLDLFPVGFSFWFPFIWPVIGKGENTYRAATTTKVINYHSTLDRVLVIDNGSQVSTDNLVYDAETGEPVITKTNNEFDKPVYTINYPAYWAFSGMGPAYKNISATYIANFRDGVIDIPTDIFESGDELYLIDEGTPSTDACAAEFNNNTAVKLWAFDTDKDTKSLTNTTPHFVFMDKDGLLYSREHVFFKLIRSGKRNMLDAKLMSLVSMTNPVVPEDAEISQLTINAGTIVNASAVNYKEKWQTDDDVFTRKVLVHDAATCTDTENDACDGYLEKKINPYVKGLVGNFRPDKKLVFFEYRKESVLNSPVTEPSTNLLQNGFLNNFKPYWDFNSSFNLVPDENAVTAKKWLEASEITSVNSKGLELETRQPRDPKNISDESFLYTAAQYGYNKTIPVAIASNSHYGEMFAESFEDNSYDESLNRNPVDATACSKRYINFLPANGLPDIINTDDKNFKAHTGRFVLEIPSGSQNTVAATVPVMQSGNYNYDLKLGIDKRKFLSDPGGHDTESSKPTPSSPDIYQQGSPKFDWLQSEALVTLDYVGQPDYEYGSSFDFWVNITTAKTYTFTLRYTTEDRNVASIDRYDNKLTGRIQDVDGNVISTIIDDLGNSTSSMEVEQTKTSSAISAFKVFKVYLCPGPYHIFGTTVQQYILLPGQSPTDGDNQYALFCDCNSVDYKSLLNNDDCPYTTPIPASETMLTPNVSLYQNKKMHLSTWVMEECTTPNCASSGYTNSSVEVSFGAGSSPSAVLLPAGPVIEGWQKIEGDFDVPAGASSMQLALKNNNTTSNKVYFDDIRVQPYNSSMKSYVYDPVNLRLTAQLDENNFATFYEYDEEGTLVRTKIETREGIKTLTETRTAKQKSIVEVQ